jgi:hypothetical protein
MDLFVVPTISFRLLYGFLVLRHSRREILWLGVTDYPSRSRDGHSGPADRTTTAMAERTLRRGSSVRSDGIALTMSLSSASGIFATCWDRTKNITMMLARTYR